MSMTSKFSSHSDSTPLTPEQVIERIAWRAAAGKISESQIEFEISELLQSQQEEIARLQQEVLDAKGITASLMLDYRKLQSSLLSAEDKEKALRLAFEAGMFCGRPSEDRLMAEARRLLQLPETQG